MCMALTPSDHSSSCRPKAKWQAGRGGGERGRLELYECVKSEPLSELVCMGKKSACMCVQLGASEHEKEVKRRNESTRVTGGNYVYIMSVYAEHRDCSQIIMRSRMSQ